MNGIDNIAGYTLTVGTADFVISDSIAQYDPIVDNLADGDECSYKAQFIDPSFSDDYETGRGTWNAGAGTISRTTIKTSSNNGSIVDFGAGPKVVFIVSDYESLTDMNNMVDSAEGAGSLKMTTAERTTIANLGDSSSRDVGTTAGTVAAGDDSRFGSVDIGDLTPATSIDGAELVPADQGGDGVSITVDEITANPLISVKGHTLNRYRGFSDFSKLRLAGYSAADGALLDAEPYVFNKTGDATYVPSASIFSVPGIVTSTGTSTNYAVFTLLAGCSPNLFDPAKSFEQTITVQVNPLPTGAQEYNFEVGFCAGPATASPTLGVYFAQSSATANWTGVVKNGGGTSTLDTLIPMVATALTVLKVRYDADDEASNFYVNGAYCGQILNSTRVLATNTPLFLRFALRKTVGATAATAAYYDHVYDVGVPDMLTGY